MSMKANDYSGSSNYEAPDPLEPGAYNARVVHVLNTGLQPRNPYRGEEKTPKIMFSITYELADEFLSDEDGEPDLTKPRWVSESFPINSLDSERAKSTARYLALDPSNEHDGDWSELVGLPCVVTLVQNRSKKNEKVIYNNVASVQPMRSKDASKLGPLVGEPKLFDFYDPDVKVFLSLPPFIQKMIKGGLDFKGSKLEKLLEDVDTDKKKSDKKTVKDEEETDDNW